MNDPCRALHERWQLERFLDCHPDLHVSFLPQCGLRIEGDLVFSAASEGFARLEDAFSIRLEVTADFPRSIPRVFEIAERIPKNYHHLSDGSLCLGSPLRQRILMAQAPTLCGFVNLLLIPYLYNRSYFEKHEVLPIGELDHGAPGLVSDYEAIFRVKGVKACIGMLDQLGLHKRHANKRPCPCGSGRRLGRCHNFVLNPLRRMAPRSEFRHQLRILRSQIEAGKD